MGLRFLGLVAVTALLAALPGASVAGERRVGRAGVTVALPAGWYSAPAGASSVTDPVTRVAVSSAPFRDRNPRCFSRLASYAPPPRGVGLVIVEWQELGQGDPLPGPLAAQTLALQPPPAIECFGGAGGSVFFAERARRFGAYVLLGRRAPPVLAEQARAVLATLAVQPVRPAELVPLAPRRLEHCRRAVLLRPACPHLVPRVRAPYLGNLSTGLLRPGSASRLAVFNLERGGEDPRRPERNRPPRMGHLVVAAGEVEALSAGAFASSRSARLRNGLLRLERSRPLELGPVRWAGRRGRLLLAPPYLRGGMLGNHLVFRWRQRGTDFVVSLHAWEPLREAVATLRAIVGSTGRG